MLTDTKQEIIKSTRAGLKEVQGDLNLLLGNLPAIELNELLYNAIASIQEASDALGYIGIMIKSRGEE